MPLSLTSSIKLARQVAGWLLIALGLLYIVFFTLATMGLGSLYLGREQDIAHNISLTGIAGPFVTGTILLVGGMVLREGKKYSVLFLRPFNSIANEKAMGAFSRKLGRQFTVVALDDGSIPPPRRSIIRVLVSIFIFAPVALVLFVVGALVTPTRYSTLADHIPVLLVLSAAIALTRAAWRGTRQPEERPIVESRWALKRAVLRAKALSTWGLRALSPRVIIVKTSHDLWQTAVRDIGKVVDLAIIDVSRYSDSIDWEVNFLKETKPHRSLVITSTSNPNAPAQCQFAGAAEMYDVSPVVDHAFEKRVRARLQEMLRVQRNQPKLESQPGTARRNA